MIKDLLAIALYVIAAFLASGAGFFALGSRLTQERRLKAALAVLAVLTAVIVMVLVAAGWEMARA